MLQSNKDDKFFNILVDSERILKVFTCISDLILFFANVEYEPYEVILSSLFCQCVSEHQFYCQANQNQTQSIV